MAENKTQPTDEDVESFLSRVPSDRRREDARVVMEMMRRITGKAPVMWGESMIGFGRYHYRYDSGREGSLFVTGLSPRKAALTLYILPGYRDLGHLLDRLGKHRTGKSCLYINKLADVDVEVLEAIIQDGVDYMRAHYETE